MLLIGAGSVNYSMCHHITPGILILPLISHSITVKCHQNCQNFTTICYLFTNKLAYSTTTRMQQCVIAKGLVIPNNNILFLILRTSTLFVYKQSHMVYICMKLHNILSPVWKLQIMDVPHNTNQPTTLFPWHGTLNSLHKISCNQAKTLAFS